MLAVPGGGAPAVREVARILRAPPGVVVARNIAAPRNQEAALCAVAQEGRVKADRTLLEELHIGGENLQGQAEAQKQRKRRSLLKYRG